MRRARWGACSIIVASILVAWAGAGCKAVIDADGYTLDDGVGACGSIVPKIDVAAWKACVLSVACVPGDPPYTISECLTFDPAADYTSATRDYRSCADVFDDVGAGYTLHGECAAGEPKERCEGDIAVHCNPSEPGGGRMESCEHRGTTCQLLGAPGEERASCVVPKSCSGTSAASCADNYFYECIDGVAVGESCSEINAQCDDQASPPGCYLDTVLRCDAAVPPCVGEKAQECNVDAGRLYEYDCGQRGLTCDPTVGPVCVNPGCDRDDYLGCTEACGEPGTLAQVCFGGVPMPLDCTLLVGEASRCEERTRGFDGARYVRCSVE